MRTNFSKKIVKKAVQNLNRGNAARRNVNADSGMIPRSEVKNIINVRWFFLFMSFFASDKIYVTNVYCFRRP